ncbi:MAG: Signal transduction histidine kinase, partial [Phycisphaerales bacterium]|nr:Signal transduction histidine kinase [Phycisphaerales bacterium]
MTPPQPQTPSSHLTTSLHAVFMTVAAVVLSSGIITYVMGQAVIRSSSRLSHAESIVRHIHDAMSTIKDAETGQRGFVITGNESYLA